MDKLHIEYFCYDIDDNLLHMPTKINMINLKTGNKESVSSEKFAEIRNDKENWAYADDAFIEFRDFGPRGPEGFREDLIYAIRHKDFAPSWDKFILTLENGCLFALITARGNAPQSFRMGVEWIIDNFLSKHQKDKMYNNLLKYVKLFGESHSADEYPRIIENYEDFSKCELVSQYLDNCDYYGVTNPEFVEKYKSGGADSPEKGKEIALKKFIKKVKKMADSIGARTSIGMSDDDIRNVLHVEQVFKELLKIYPDTIFRLYDTSNRGYKKMVVESRVKRYVDFIKETSEQAPGLESSILPFTQFGNMTGHLYPQGPDQRQVDFANEFKRKTKYLSKTSKDLLGKKKDEEDEEIEESWKNKLMGGLAGLILLFTTSCDNVSIRNRGGSELKTPNKYTTTGIIKDITKIPMNDGTQYNIIVDDDSSENIIEVDKFKMSLFSNDETSRFWWTSKLKIGSHVKLVIDDNDCDIYLQK